MGKEKEKPKKSNCKHEPKKVKTSTGYYLVCAKCGDILPYQEIKDEE